MKIMTVKELLYELSALNPNMRVDVLGPTCDGKNGYPIKDIDIAETVEDGEKKKMVVLVLGTYND